MKSLIPVIALAICLSACAGKTETEAEEPMVGAETCLENPEMAKEWGECNVKKTIYDAKDKISSCTKTSKLNRETVLKIKLHNNGRVKELLLEDSVEKNKKVAQCLHKEISKLRFAPAPQGVKPIIMYPIEI